MCGFEVFHLLSFKPWTNKFMVLTVTCPSKVISEHVHKDISNLKKKLKAVIKEILNPDRRN